jgi:hypothetical protein
MLPKTAKKRKRCRLLTKKSTSYFKKKGGYFFTFGECTPDAIEKVEMNKNLSSSEKYNQLQDKQKLCCSKVKRKFRKSFCKEVDDTLLIYKDVEDTRNAAKNILVEDFQESIRQKNKSPIKPQEDELRTNEKPDDRSQLQRLSHKLAKTFGFPDVFPRKSTKEEPVDKNTFSENSVPVQQVNDQNSSIEAAGLPAETGKETETTYAETIKPPKVLLPVTLGQYIKFLCFMKTKGIDFQQNESKAKFYLNDNFELVLKATVLIYNIEIVIASLPLIEFNRNLNPEDKKGNFTIFFPSEPAKQNFLKNIIDFYDNLHFIVRTALNSYAEIKSIDDLKSGVLEQMKTPQDIFLDLNFVGNISAEFQNLNGLVQTVYLETFLDKNVIDTLKLSVPEIKLILKNCDKVMEFVNEETTEMPKELDELLRNRLTLGGNKRKIKRRNKKIKKSKKRRAFGKRTNTGTRKRS